ncbi:MAG: hypothetical protein KF842_13020 [Caulobacter sp.]|nr:hypothetical protein [Caulobacter sp.]
MSQPPKPPVDDKSAREARLAQALRANLRRRKAAARTAPKSSAPKSHPAPKPD